MDAIMDLINGLVGTFTDILNSIVGMLGG